MEEDKLKSFFSFLENLTENDLNRLKQFLREACNVLMTYNEAAAEVGKTKNALTAKISRSNIKPVRLPPMLRYSDVKMIKDKKV